MLSLPWRARLIWAAALAVIAAGLFACYLLQSRTGVVSSDSASMALQASDMLHGNVLLHGWWLSDLSFYTVELPEFVLVEAIHGLRPDDVHITAALTYTLLVLLTALVARGAIRGREGIVRALLAGGIMVAPTLGYTTNTLLDPPDHTGTGVPLMAAFLLLDRLRPRWWVPPLVMIILAWAQVGDPLVLVAGVAPVAATGLWRAGLRLLRRLRHRPGGDDPAWFDLALAGAAGLSVPIARYALLAIQHHGGFYVNPVPGSLFASTSAWPHNLHATGLSVLILFGADLISQPAGLPIALAAVHIAGLVAASLGLLAGIWQYFRRPDRVSQILLTGTLVMLAAGWLSTHVTSGFSAHEIAVVLPFSAALAGRMLAARLIQFRLEPVLAAVLAAYLFALGYNCTRPPVPPSNSDLASLLVAHHLRMGIAGYWQANSVTLDSGGQVTLASIYGGSPGHWEVNAAWYDPVTRYANFLVMVSDPAEEAVFTKPAIMRRLFGRPVTVYHLGRYTVQVYDRNLLTTLIPFPPTP